jgi:hypothetical protein
LPKESDAHGAESQSVLSERLGIIGSGTTAYNFYAPTAACDAIIIGVSEAADAWTDVARLGKETAARFATALAKSGLSWTRPNLDVVEDRRWKG